MKSSRLFGWLLLTVLSPLAANAADLDDVTIRMMDPSRSMAIDHVIQLPEAHRVEKRDDKRAQGRDHDRRREREQDRHREREQDRHQEDRDHESDRHHDTERAREIDDSAHHSASGGDDKGGHTEPGDDKLPK